MNHLQDIYHWQTDEKYKFVIDRLIQWIIENDIPSYHYEDFLSRLMNFEFIEYLPIENMNEIVLLINKIITNNQFAKVQ